ncbi:hypothetical protein Bca52824_065958 [Brassica carinata]|uniref:Uncharacterized protein n=1 Tax=Brassica carinata TaxID=52824 RepID=A0A8X7QKA5_BRACI|nr:hypothetical protein Bca52824_065958 [Brassica carinata]
MGGFSTRFAQMFLTLSGFVVILMKNILLRPRTGFCSMGGKLMGSIHIVVFCASLHERTKEVYLEALHSITSILQQQESKISKLAHSSLSCSLACLIQIERSTYLHGRYKKHIIIM